MIRVLGRRLAAAATALAIMMNGPPASAQEVVAPLTAHLPALAGDYFALPSHEVERTFHIHVRLPDGYDPARSALYPVVYVLDGDSLFPLLAASHLFIALDDKLPEAIIVGIAYGSFDPAVNKRNIDFTPPARAKPPADAGAPAFARFLRNELLPRIETRYRANPARRILFGQSRGGSFVLYSAFTDPDTFWGRVASNPSFALDREVFAGKPGAATRSDLQLIVASGTKNNPRGREDALDWSRTWGKRSDTPWNVDFFDIADGTHAANAGDAYRLGLRLLFKPASP